MKQLDVTQFEGYKEAQTNLVQLRKDINRKMKARIMECNPGDDQHLFIDSTGNITEQGFELLDFVGQTEKVKTLIKREKNLKLSIADAESYVRTIQQLCEESLQYKLNVYATIDRIQNYCILFAHGCLTVKDVRLIQRCFFDFLTEKMNAAKSCCDSYTFTDFAFRKDDEYLRYQRSKFYLCEVSEKLNNLQQGSSLVDLAKAIQIVHNTPWFIVDHSFGDVYEIIPTDKCILFCVYNNNCTQKSFSFLIYVHGDEFKILCVTCYLVPGSGADDQRINDVMERINAILGAIQKGNQRKYASSGSVVNGAKHVQKQRIENGLTVSTIHVQPSVIPVNRHTHAVQTTACRQASLYITPSWTCRAHVRTGKNGNKVYIPQRTMNRNPKLLSIGGVNIMPPKERHIKLVP